MIINAINMNGANIHKSTISRVSILFYVLVNCLLQIFFRLIRATRFFIEPRLRCVHDALYAMLRRLFLNAPCKKIEEKSANRS